jgi:tetratricopeptide (TPR) repeat protein
MIMTKQPLSRSEPFYDQVRLALNNFHDPQWLGENSPLAAPYFLGAALHHQPAVETAVGRGQILQRTLREAAAILWAAPLPPDGESLAAAVQQERLEQGNKGAFYHYLLLELRYFRQYFRPSVYPRMDSEYDIRDYLNVGRGPFFNHLKSACNRLAEALLQQVRPTFRLEQPWLPPERWLGQEGMLGQCLTALQQGQAVAITGAGGTGKTSLASMVAAGWPSQPVFWFTIRPTVNDQLSSLLFSLGYYLHQQGASNLWLQLVADGGKVNHLNLALEQVRGDLQTLAHNRPLLCFDEVEHLYPADPDKVGVAQVQIREFLDGLQGLAPLLLTGQQQGLAANVHIELRGLSLAQTAVLFKHRADSFTPAEVRRIHDYTGGNPRLLHLCLALHEPQRSLAAIIADAPHTPALQALFARIWQQLDAAQRQLLSQLAVFRTPAPADAWREQQAILQPLIQQRLVQQDGGGGLSLLPVLHDLLCQDSQRLPAERRDQYHLGAASIRATRGEYTAAAYHYLEAGDYGKAIQVWFPQRQREIRRGQGQVALRMFQQISARRVAETEGNALALLRSELYQLVGEPEKGLAELEAATWSPDTEIAGQALLLQGNFLNALGYPQAALTKYSEGIQVTTRLSGQLIRFHCQRGLAHLQQRQMREAVREARLAQYEAEHLQGLVQEEQGNFEEAFLSYQRALALAKSIDHEPGMAQIQRELAALLGRQGRLAEAVGYAEAAIAYYERVGDRLNLEKARNALVVMHFQSGQFDQVIEIATLSLPFFEGAMMPFWAAATAATLAEAYFETGQPDKAEYYAGKVLKLEEPQSHPYALYTLGLVRRAAGRFGEAEQFFAEARQSAQANDDKYMAAYAWRALGEVLCEQEEMARGQQAISQALRLFEELGMEQEIRQTQALLA